MFSTSPLRPEAFENVRQVAIEALLTNKERVPKQHFDGIMDVLDTTYLPGFHEDDDVACIDIAPGLTTGRTALMPVKPLGTVRVNLTGIKPDNPDDNSRQEVMPRGEHGNAIPEFKFDYKLSNDGRLTSLEKIYFNPVMLVRAKRSRLRLAEITIHEAAHVNFYKNNPDLAILADIKGFSALLDAIEEFECYGIEKALGRLAFYLAPWDVERKYQRQLSKAVIPDELDLSRYPIARRLLEG